MRISPFCQSMSCLLIGTHSETRIAVLRKNSNTALSLRCSRYSLKLVTPFTSVLHASRNASISQSARNSIGFSISANGSTPSTGFSFIIFCFRIQVKNADRLRLSLFTVDAMFPAPRKPVAWYHCKYNSTSISFISSKDLFVNWIKCLIVSR